MQVLTPEHMKMLKLLAQRESSIVNLAYAHNKEFGEIFLSNSITDFKEEYLKQQYGDVIPSMSTEYRFFILQLLDGVEEKYKADAIAFVLKPSFEAKTEELLNAIKNLQGDVHATT